MTTNPELIPSGIPGLDLILGGGLRPGHLYFLEGSPGTGKTTLALQFLLEGVRRQEPCLLVSLAETSAEIDVLAASHGWDISGLAVRDLAEPGQVVRSSALFELSELELEERVQALVAEIESLRPRRLVLDAVSALRALSEQPGRFRRQVELFRSKANELGCTLLAADHQVGEDDHHPRSLAWGIIRMEQQVREYGPVRRRLWLPKLRAQSFSSGCHDFRIVKGGIQLFPRLLTDGPAPAPAPAPQIVSTGTAALDALLGGGLQRGTSTGLIGPSGCGKSTLACSVALAAADRGERVAYYLFDESIETFSSRAASQGLDLNGPVQQGLIALRKVDLAELSPGELTREFAELVDTQAAQVIVIDSLNGLLQAMPDERFLILHLHGLLSYLSTRGTLTILTLAQPSPAVGHHGLTLDLSYLTDTLIAQRYFEAYGTLRYAVSVLKKRYGDHERKIREYQIGAGGIRVGEPLSDFRGVLGGVPEYVGERKPLL